MPSKSVYLSIDGLIFLSRLSYMYPFPSVRNRGGCSGVPTGIDTVLISELRPCLLTGHSMHLVVVQLSSAVTSSSARASHTVILHALILSHPTKQQTAPPQHQKHMANRLPPGMAPEPVPARTSTASAAAQKKNAARAASRKAKRAAEKAAEAGVSIDEAAGALAELKLVGEKEGTAAARAGAAASGEATAPVDTAKKVGFREFTVKHSIGGQTGEQRCNTM